MRFSEWMEKLNKQQSRLHDLALSEVSESISISDGKLVEITIGKGTYDVSVNGRDTGVRFLRSLYTNNKEAFDVMLESITEGTDRVVEATREILTLVADEAIPQAVIERMKGDQTSGDPSDLVEQMAERKLLELSGAINRPPFGMLQSFVAELGELAGKELTISFDPRGLLRLNWGRLTAHLESVSIPDTEEAMYFVANYDLIKERLLKFVEQLRAIK